jgi:outer membrane lipoprotein-sorting protein
MDWCRAGYVPSHFVACFEALVRKVRFSLLSPLFVMGATLLWTYSATGQENAASIIQHSSEANDRDLAAVPEFDNSERDRNKDGDKTYAVTMLLGSPYQRLIAVKGQNLSAARQKEEQEKYEKAVAERQHESADKRSQRIAKYQADRKRDQTLIQQLTTAFDFRLIGKRSLNGFRVYVLKATPRRGYKPINRDSEVLTGMEGTMWIDQKTFQWVKVEAHVIHPVRIEGFLAEVEPGTKFEVEKRPVSGDIWLASHYSMTANAKALLLFPHRVQEDDSYFDYHKTSDASVGQ